MSREGSLKENPCKFERPGKLRSEVDPRIVEKNVAAEVLYACRHWVHHLKEANADPLDADLVLAFLQGHFLCWIETLAWIGRISEGVSMIISLRWHFKVSSL